MQFRNFQKPKIKLKKRPLNVLKSQKQLYGGSNKILITKTPPKVGILIQNTISKFSKNQKSKSTKNPLCSKNTKNTVKKASNHKVIENKPPFW